MNERMNIHQNEIITLTQPHTVCKTGNENCFLIVLTGRSVNTHPTDRQLLLHKKYYLRSPTFQCLRTTGTATGTADVRVCMYVRLYGIVMFARPNREIAVTSVLTKRMLCRREGSWQ